MIRPVVILAGFLSHLLIAGCITLPGPFARQSPPENPGLWACRWRIFAQADRNADSVLDPAEAAAPPMALSRRFFDKVDENQDGVLDRQEYEKMEILVRCEWCPKVADCPLGRSGQASNGSTTY